jgi:hypothetical protein
MDTSFHAPINLADDRPARVAKARPIGRRAPPTDQLAERLQAQLKSTEKAATTEERVFFVITLLGCASLVVALAVHFIAPLFA